MSEVYGGKKRTLKFKGKGRKERDARIKLGAAKEEGGKGTTRSKCI